MILVENLTFRYGSRGTPVFDHFNWQVAPGEMWSIIGASGCGKTTLLTLLAGLRRITGGTIRVGETVIRRPRPETGLILQDYGLLPWATVWDNVALGLRVRRFYGPDGKHAPRTQPPSRKEARVMVEGWLRRLNIYEQRNKFPGAISGGQRQRTAIARTLALQPDVLLMDEPFSSLDAPTREDLQTLILQLRAEMNLTSVIVTHAIEEAAILGRKILVLGEPPNTDPVIVSNPDAGTLGYRSSAAFLEKCNTLRELFGTERMNDVLKASLKQVANLALALMIFVACWAALAAYLHRDIMPYPWQVWPVFVHEMRGDLWDHTLISARRVLSAIALAVLVATPIGLGLGQIRVLNRIFSPLIGLVHPVPKIVFLPVILVVMGIGENSKVFLIALILFFQILVVVRDEAAGLRPELIQSVRSLGAGRRALFRYVYLPASLPAVLTALRVSVGTAIAVLFIAEQYSTRSGLGYYIVTLTWQRLHFEEMYAGIMAMSLLGLVLYIVVDVLERIFGSWRRAGES